jgi:hypothetical protein
MFYFSHRVATAKPAFKRARNLDSSTLRPLLFRNGCYCIFRLSKPSFLSKRHWLAQILLTSDFTCRQYYKLCGLQAQPVFLAANVPDVQLYICHATMGSNSAYSRQRTSRNEKFDRTNPKNYSNYEGSGIWSCNFDSVVLLPAKCVYYCDEKIWNQEVAIVAERIFRKFARRNCNFFGVDQQRNNIQRQSTKCRVVQAQEC